MVLIWDMKRIPKRKVCKILVTFIHLHSDHDKHLFNNIGVVPPNFKYLEAKSSTQKWKLCRKKFDKKTI